VMEEPPKESLPLKTERGQNVRSSVAVANTDNMCVLQRKVMKRCEGASFE
jgi:hypothetical protein